MTTYNDLTCELTEGVLVVRLNRPEKRNAMRMELRAELIDCLTSAENDEVIRAVIVTGSGDKAFSAGADLNELQERTVNSEMSRAAEARRRLPQVAETLSKPLVAAINGACIGAGLEFALACAIRISADAAVFGLPEVQLGVIPGSGGTQRLVRVVGQGWALHLTLLGQPIDAETALRIGLVTHVVPAAALMDEALTIAKWLGAHPPLAYQVTRDAVVRASDMDLATGLDYERKAFALCLSTGEVQHRAQALLKQRSSGSKRAKQDSAQYIPESGTR